MTFLGAVRVRNKEDPCIIGITDAGVVDTEGRIYHEDMKIETIGDTVTMHAGDLESIEYVMNPVREIEETGEHQLELIFQGCEELASLGKPVPYFLCLEGGIEKPEIVEISKTRRVNATIFRQDKTLVLHGRRDDYGRKGHRQMRRSLDHLPQTIGEGLLWAYHVAQCATADRYTDNNFQFVIASKDGVCALYPSEVLQKTVDIDHYIEDVLGDESFRETPRHLRMKEIQVGRRSYFREQFIGSYALFRLVLDMTYHRWIDFEEAQINASKDLSLPSRHALVMRRSAFQHRLNSLEKMGELLKEADIMQIQAEGLNIVAGVYDQDLQSSYS